MKFEQAITETVSKGGVETTLILRGSPYGEFTENGEPIKINIAHSVRTNRKKPPRPCGKVINGQYTIEEFVEIIKRGFIFKHSFDMGSIRGFAAKEITSPLLKIPSPYWNTLREILGDFNDRVPVRFLQRQIAARFSQYQCVFFDIDKGGPYPLKTLIQSLTLTPNIIYETFSHTNENPRYRLVYLLDRQYDSETYSQAYDFIKRHIGGNIKFDDSCRTPTQSIYGTYGKNVYIVERDFYHLTMYEKRLPEPPKMAGADNDNPPGLPFLPPIIPNPKDIPLDATFYEYAVTHTMKEVLDFFSPTSNLCSLRCTIVDHETRWLNEKFVTDPRGLLTLPKFVGKGKKLVLNDYRKRMIEKITYLLLLMCGNISLEDLVYNVFRWCHEHISFNPEKNSHILDNKLIIDKVKNAYVGFSCRAPCSPLDDYVVEIGLKNRRPKIKKAINPYYLPLHRDMKTFFSSYIDMDKYWELPDATYEELKAELADMKMERNKPDHPRSDKGKKHKKAQNTIRKKVIKMLEDGLTEKEIEEQTKISKSYLNQIIRTYNQVKS